ncbi:MAG: sialidase family protein [Thiohalocapsa sp.]
MIRSLLSAALLVPAAVLGQPWSFADPISVAGPPDSGDYHHLDGAGRRHIAASQDEVAVAWEDDRTGSPQIYLAVKPDRADEFPAAQRLSDGEEAYEPALVAIDDGRWLAAWEQDGAIKARLIDPSGPGPIAELAAKDSGQVTLANDGTGRLAALWARRQAGGQLIQAAELRANGRTVELAETPVAVALGADHPYQAYPSAIWTPDGRLVVAWEDRRAGHTRLLFSSRTRGQDFAPPGQLNAFRQPTSEDGKPSQLGTGAMRVVLASAGKGLVRAVWLDKRNASSGYAVWGAASDDGGRSFGPNQIVQDQFGADVAQWHAALTGGSNGFVAAWDDPREGWSDPDETGDVLISWNQGGDWSADLVVPGAFGNGYQGSPAVALDPKGVLHLVWIERADLRSPTSLRYLRAEPVGDPTDWRKKGQAQ